MDLPFFFFSQTVKKVVAFSNHRTPLPAVRVVRIQKIRGEGIGLGIVGGIDSDRPVAISSVVPTLPVAREGSLQVGDQILAVSCFRGKAVVVHE